MTAAQARVYGFVIRFIDKNRYPPTIREVADALGLGSPATVQAHLDALREQGVLEGTGRRLRLPRESVPR